jgi:hypothetical protein
LRESVATTTRQQGSAGESVRLRAQKSKERVVEPLGGFDVDDVAARQADMTSIGNRARDPL